MYSEGTSLQKQKEKKNQEKMKNVGPTRIQQENSR